MRALSLSLPFVGAAIAIVGAPADAQEIRYLPQGEMEVHFPGPCTVYYTNRGARTHSDSSCSSGQRTVADQLVATRNYGNHPGYGQGYYEYRITDIRADRVRFSDGCKVTYNGYGIRTGSSDPCNKVHRQRADEAMREWRSGHGYGYGGSNNWDVPQVIPEYGGVLHVRFRDGCDVRYNSYGVRFSADDKCSRDQRSQADDASKRYRREQGY